MSEMEVDSYSRKRSLSDNNNEKSVKKKKKNTTKSKIQNKWKDYERPTLPTIDPEKDSIAFQKFQIDYYIGDQSPNFESLVTGQIPIIRCYGVTREGYSVQANLVNFLPYIYTDCPSDFEPEHCSALLKAINASLPTTEKTKDQSNDSVVSIEMVRGSSIFGYDFGKKSDFVKITLCTPRIVASCRTMLENGLNVDGTFFRFSTFESNIAFVLRFMIDVGLVGAGWMELKPGTYSIIDKSSERSSSECQLEVDALWSDVIAHKAEGQWADIAPIRKLSLDIECAGRKRQFPEAEKDPVIQIANYVHVHGQPEGDNLIKVIFCLKKVSPLPEGSMLLCFDDEREMLREYKRFIGKVDPDVILGYNLANFDLPYLINRAKHLRVEEFEYLGRLTHEKIWKKRAVFSSKAYGTRESEECHFSGRVILDILTVIMRDYKLRSYTLNNVALHFLKEQKEGVDHTEITGLFMGSEDDRRRLAIYCLKDAYLPQRLMDKLMMLYNQVEMARVTGVPFDYLYSKGQQIKVISQLFRKAREENKFIPFYVKEKKGSEDDDSYEGASVFDPERGFHDEPIATLDFSSLYPTIVIAHNMCYSTLLTREQIQSMTPDQYELTPLGDPFLRPETYKGILPKILEELLVARKKAKDDLKNEKDPFKMAVLDGRQLALKVSANSVYGFTGATVGRLPCLAISAGVTAYGRDLIELTRSLVLEKYTKENGYPGDAKVIYGDTDSVMVKFGVKTVEEAMKLGAAASDSITEKIGKPPVKLIFEKVYYPFLLMSKKRYAGLYWTKPDKPDKLDSKGLETVRRDPCKLVSQLIETSLKKILVDKDVEGAKAYVRETVSNLLQDKIDMSLLVISKGMTKAAEDYTNRQPHTEVVKKMVERDPHTAPGIGDRIKYVMVSAHKKSLKCDQAEDPIYVMENDIPLDYHYYLTNQLSQPILRVFKAIMDNPETLLNGDHTRRRVIQVPTQGIMGIPGFVTKIATCLGCNATLRNSEKTVCPKCKWREHEIQLGLRGDAKPLDDRNHTLVSQCFECQGRPTTHVKCSNTDCPIFYERTKVKKDLKKITDTLARFDMSW